MTFARTLAPAWLLTIAVGLTPLAASAVTRNITFQANATGVCQAALPAYEGVIRKRPLGIFNEGTTQAFVTCSPISFVGMNLNSGHTLYFFNQSGAQVTINCTAVIGVQGFSTPNYIAQSVSMANNVGASLNWDGGFSTFNPFNTSCLLAPGVGITAIQMSQILDVGA